MDNRNTTVFFLKMLAILVIPASFGIVSSVWLHVSSQPVVYKPPVAQLPKPNAYDYYLAATKAIVCRPQIVEAVSQIPPVNSSNSASIAAMGGAGPRTYMPGMRAGMPGMGMYGIPGTKLSKLPQGVPKELTLTRLYNLKEKHAVLNANAHVFELLNKAYECSKCYMPNEPVDFSNLTEYDGIWQLFNLRHQLCTEEGKMRDAILVDLMEYKAGIDILQNGGHFAMHESVSCRERVSRRISLAMNNLSADQAIFIAVNMQRIMKSMPKLGQLGASLKRDVLNSAAALLNEKDWRAQIGMPEIYDYKSTNEFTSKLIEVENKLLGLTLSRRGYFEVSVDAYEQIEKELSKSFPSISFDVPHIINESVKEDANNVLKCIAMSYTSRKALDEMLVMSLLLDAYKIQHGRYPASLAEVSQNYIVSIPSDPFTKSSPYIYKRTNDDYILYSVGPNSKDDHGDAILNVDGISDEKQIGDLVAGVSK